MNTQLLKPLSDLRREFGIESPKPTTHLAWTIDLARKHGEPGLRYALALKINHALHIDPPHVTGFRVLVAEVLTWGNDQSAALLTLLNGDYAWAARYVVGQVPGLPKDGKPPAQLPLPPVEINYLLAGDLIAADLVDGDLAGHGLPYALRYYTAPSCVGDNFRLSTESCSLFLSKVMARQDWLSKQLIKTLAWPEFSPIAHLLPRSDDSDGKGGAVLDITRA